MKAVLAVHSSPGMQAGQGFRQEAANDWRAVKRCFNFSFPEFTPRWHMLWVLRIDNNY
jgi:hypothetical protein